jgi:hypothetical protein
MAMIVAAVSAGSWPLGTTVTAASSADGGSSASNWLLSNAEGKKWACLVASRRTTSSRETLRKIIRASGRPVSRASR